MTYTGPDRRTSKWWPRFQATGPYIAICIVVVVGFFVQGRNSDRIEDEAIERDRAICADGNHRAEGVVAFVERLVSELDLPFIDGQALVQLAVESFPQQECPPPPD